jgi:hypothetical protein
MLTAAVEAGPILVGLAGNAEDKGIMPLFRAACATRSGKLPFPARIPRRPMISCAPDVQHSPASAPLPRAGDDSARSLSASMKPMISATAHC